MDTGILAWILVLVLHCWSGQSQKQVLAKCNDDITLPCSISTPGSTYRYMVWYRNKIAIIKKKVNDVTFFNNSSPAAFGVQDALVLLNAQPSDNGYYQCFLAADVGQKDRESYVSLTVSECVTKEWLITTQTTNPGKQCPEIVEVSALWLLLGSSSIAIFKIILCTTFVMEAENVWRIQPVKGFEPKCQKMSKEHQQSPKWME